MAAHGVLRADPVPGAAGGLAWRITEDGLHRLRYSSQLSEGRLLLEPRQALPLEDRTPWELACALLDDGWEWHPLPRAVPARLKLAPLQPQTNGPNMFFSGWEPSVSYMLALLQPARLQALGIDAVPHGQPDRVYVDLLKGRGHAKEGWCCR